MPALLVAAYAPELAHLPDHVRAKAIGIGLVEAAAGTAAALLEPQARPELLVLVGSAGALPGSGLDVGTVCAVDTAVLAERSCEYLPEPQPRIAEASRSLVVRAAAAGLEARRCVSGLGVTRSSEEAGRLAKSAALEHLECFAVLRVAAHLGVPAIAILSVANQVGPSAHAEWMANRQRAEAAAQAAALRFLG
jgi:purine-nucleoside phosphorylase